MRPDSLRPESRQAAPADPARLAALRARAEELEGVFLAEMLAHAGLKPIEGGFGGGVGEDQFASFLRQEQAAAMVRRGGLGLAEQLFQSLMRADRHD